MAHKPLLNEPASPRTQLTILLGLGAGAAALLFLAIRETGGLLRTMYIVFAGVAVLLAAAAVLIGRRYRCVMDEYGVQLGHARLAWADIRTAAVIRRDVLPAFLSRFPDEQHFILLSVRPPEAALDKHHFRMEAPQPDIELRIPLTAQRRRVIQQQLHMTLPEIVL